MTLTVAAILPPWSILETNLRAMIYIFWSCKDRLEAKKIIHSLLCQKLIACASIFPEVESIYRWEGKIEESKEAKVILKTLKPFFEKVRQAIQAECSYEVPEIISIDAAQVNPSYLAWVMQEIDVEKPH